MNNSFVKPSSLSSFSLSIKNTLRHGSLSYRSLTVSLSSNGTSTKNILNGLSKRLISTTTTLSSSNIATLKVLPNDIRKNFDSCVGNTPLIQLRALSEETGCTVSIY